MSWIGNTFTTNIQKKKSIRFYITDTIYLRFAKVSGVKMLYMHGAQEEDLENKKSDWYGNGWNGMRMKRSHHMMRKEGKCWAVWMKKSE